MHKKAPAWICLAIVVCGAPSTVPGWWGAWLEDRGTRKPVPESGNLFWRVWRFFTRSFCKGSRYVPTVRWLPQPSYTGCLATAVLFLLLCCYHFCLCVQNSVWADAWFIKSREFGMQRNEKDIEKRNKSSKQHPEFCTGTRPAVLLAHVVPKWLQVSTCSVLNAVLDALQGSDLIFFLKMLLDHFGRFCSSPIRYKHIECPHEAFNVGVFFSFFQKKLFDSIWLVGGELFESFRHGTGRWPTRSTRNWRETCKNAELSTHELLCHIIL